MNFHHSIGCAIAALFVLVACDASELDGAEPPHRPPASSSRTSIDSTVDLARAELAGASEPETCGAPAVSQAADQEWLAFRQAYPFHVQTLALTKARDDGTRVLIVSEPPPNLSRREWDAAICRAFDGVRGLARKRHKVGFDGWVEDVVVELDVADLAADDSLALQAGIETLYLSMFGTLYKAHAIALPTHLPGPMDRGAPRLDVGASELRKWLFDEPAIFVSSLGERRAFDDVMGAVETGVWRSEDGLLVAWLVDRKSDLADARADFRAFALESDAIVGGVTRGDRSLAVVGRSRQSMLSVVPPLRFEDVFRLAQAASSDELAQSYERNLPFAGKILGEEGRDWAPILLSDSLLDTEFGSLLNITDQMLKSWSQAGQIEYVDFPYPKPNDFPFDRPLSVELFEESGAVEVLFNWNTAGVGAVYEYPDYGVYSVLSTGALPVTYGSDAGNAGSGRVEIGELQAYEDEAYGYFVGLGNPYLARVVQYTALYQMFHEFGVSADPGAFDSTAARRARAGLQSEVRSALGRIADGSAEVAPEYGEFVLANLPSQADSAAEWREQRVIMAEVVAGDLDIPSASVTDLQIARFIARFELDEARSFVSLVSRHFGATGLDRLAKVLADPRSLDVEKATFLEFRALAEAASRSAAEKAVEMLVGGADPRELVVTSLFEALEKRPPSSRDRLMELALLQFSRPVASVFAKLPGVSEVRDAFAKDAKHEPRGSVRTASLVLSWNRSDATSVGGHNLGSKVTRILSDTSVPVGQTRIARVGDEIRVTVNPKSTGSAHRVSRVVERNASKGDAEISGLVRRELAVERPVRAASKALDVQQAGFRTHGIGKSQFGADLEVFTTAAAREIDGVTRKVLVERAAAQKLDVLVTRSPQGDLVLVDRTRGIAEPVLTGPQLISRLREVAPKSDAPLQVRFEGITPSSAESVLRTLSGAGGGGGRIPPRPPVLASSGEPGWFGFSWFKRGKSRGNSGTNRSTGSGGGAKVRRGNDGHLDGGTIARLSQKRPDWSEATLKQSADGSVVTLRQGGREAIIEIEVPARAIAEGPIEAEILARSPRPFTESGRSAFEELTRRSLEESGKRRHTVPQAAEQLKRDLIDRLGVDDVELKLQSGELAGIVIVEREAVADDHRG
ncbi:MAG: hypothetical protein AAF430_09510 [Myxococcota bacterium]